MVVAHAKWFVEDLGRFGTDWAFAFAPASLTLLAVAVVGALVWRAVALRLPVPELRALQPLARLAPWMPRLLGVHLGVSLLSLAVTNAYLSPALSLDGLPGGFVIALAEGVIGVWLISGVALRPAAVLVVALGPLGLVLAGPVPVLEAADLLGIAVFLMLVPPGRDRFGAVEVDPEQLGRALLVLRTCLGVALIVVAFTEKLASPAIAVEFLDRYPALDVFRLVGLDLGPEAFVTFAAAVEVLFGLLLISGAAPQCVVLVAGIPFNATLFFLDRSELIGHLPIYGTMLALLVYGSSPAVAPLVRRLSWRPAPTQRRTAVTG